MAIEIRKLTPGDDRQHFTSGDAQLDHFFRTFAGQNQFKHHVGVTYVAVDGEKILGFTTVSTGSLESEALPQARRKHLPRYPLPVLRLARLAVTVEAHGRGVGAKLLRAVFHIALELKDRVGCVAVVVDAKPDAVGFYESYGFTPLAEVLEGEMQTHPETSAMFLPIQEIPNG